MMRWNLVAAATALAVFMTAPAAAVTHTLTLTGVLDNVSTSSFDFGVDELSFASLDLTGFSPFTLNTGDIIEFNISFTGFYLGVAPFDGFVIDPATEGGYGQLFGVNFFRTDNVDPINASNGGGSGAFVDATGDLAGISLSGGCSNCLTPIMGRSPGPFGGFMFKGLTGSTTVTLDGSYTVDRITLSSQVQSGFEAAVPEPGNWAMLIAGFGLVGAIQRRQRRVDVTA
ncbi:MAG: hypothetical protein RL490_1011 [Pseudomonadota bacterium]|jgi:hypothetical protein